MSETLPMNWERWRLADVGEWFGGGTPSSSNADFWDGDIPWVSPKDMKVAHITSAQDKITAVAVQNSAVKLISAGSVIFVTRSGILAHSFPVATTKVEVTINQDLKAITPVDVIDHAYLAWLFRALERKILSTCSKHGTTVHSIEIPALKDLRVPIPPPAEQRRIIAKLEELFSEIDKGVESLTTARKQLRTYRQAVLKHAFEGRLTKEWRARNKLSLKGQDQLETAIRADQAHQQKSDLEAWLRTVEKWRVRTGSGALPTRPENSAQATALVGSALNGLHGLPEGWAYFKVSTICSVVRGGSPRPAGDLKYYEGTIPFLKVADVTRNPGMLLSTHTFTIKEAGLSKTRMTPPETLLISNSGATLGVPKICTFEATFNDGIAAFLGLPQPYLRFVYYFWESKTAELRGVNQGAAQPNLNTSILGEMAIPMCTKEEATELVEMVDLALSESERLLAEVDSRLRQAQSLQQSILKRAFAGQLVAQDPNDEPASVLLERIKTDCEQQSSKRPHNDKNRKTEAA